MKKILIKAHSDDKPDNMTSKSIQEYFSDQNQTGKRGEFLSAKSNLNLDFAPPVNQCSRTIEWDHQMEQGINVIQFCSTWNRICHVKKSARASFS